MTAAPPLVATCWTSAGAAMPAADSERSPFDPLDRVRAAADTGWSGIGFVLDDLRHVRDTIGFPALRAAIEAAGLRHVEVELVSGWWEPEGPWREGWALLLEAARELRAVLIKAGSDFADPIDDFGPYVAPFRRLAEEAQAVGARVALEPLPFGRFATIPFGAEFVRAVDHPAAGLCVDFWHVFRAGTSLAELEASLSPEIVFCVELNDAREERIGTLFEDTRDRRELLGEGEQDVTGFIRTMRRVGFEGAWGVEILSAAHRARPLEEALRVAHDTSVAAFERASLDG
ncbi:sugar phosphate isomerase/epimerase [Gulosibacter sp. 10]|uniref:sugar phosphate isomerase/epimerase family protein n=1 Tax=Gulosibacter sp. 10 TaxID=1255570 RepID=UPI00097EFC1F|nr:sugar phosphate isomerase/epimerase family protein [Gulosibacter sp. 10]SJM71289.1 4-hydroxyphenylpyruvate dioxygenase [Gulosibacter sp. 10]